MKRRKFLHNIGKLSTAPLFLNNLPIKALTTPAMLPLLNCQGIDDRVLVVVFLKGGNDGLNTVIPVAAYDQYANLRPTIKINNTGTNKFISLDSTLPTEQQVGIHPVGTSFKQLYDEGNARIIQGIGYPQFNLSHFKSTDLWLSGGDGTSEKFNITSGWMGRYLEAAFPGIAGNSTSMFPDPLGLQLGDKKPSLALHNHDTQYIAANLTGQDPASLFGLLNGIGTSPHSQIPNSDYGEELAYIMAVENSTDAYGERITAVYNAGINSSTSYPNTSLGGQLKTVAKFLSGGSKTKIFMVHIDGFDTHGGQVIAGASHTGKHATLLTDVFDSIKAFQDDLGILGLGEKVLTVTFSEFGRRITENGSSGTDHGNLSNMFLFGKGVAPGITGTNLDLTNLTNSGNLLESSMQYDYRSVFKSLLQDWLGADDSILGSAMFDAYTKVPNLMAENYVVAPSCYIPPVCNPCDCTADMVVLSDTPIADNTVIHSADWIKTNGLIESDAQVVLQAQDYISLNHGFIAERGSEVSILIDDCQEKTNISASSEEEIIETLARSSIHKMLEDEEAELIIYPNPAKSIANIFYKIQKQQLVTIQLYSMNGRLVSVLLDKIHKEKGLWHLILDSRQFDGGSYIIHLQTEYEALSKQILFIQN